MATTWTAVTGNFNDALYSFIKQLEASKLSDRLNPKLVEGNPTIGVGFDLVAGGAEVQNEVLIRLGFRPEIVDLSVPPAAGTWQAIEYGYVKQLRAQMVKNGSIATMNQVMSTRAINTDPQFVANVAGRRSTFSFPSDTEVRAAFDNLWEPIYRNKIYVALPALNGHETFKTSYEMMALASIVWSGGQGLIGPKLRNAINTGDRAEAWYEIRYGSNKNGIHGKRRYVEAALFGLYNDNSNITADDAKAVYRMFTLHRSDILAYEAKYADLLPAANLEIDAAGLSTITSAQSLAQALGGDDGNGRAKKALLDDLIANNPSLVGLNRADYLATNIYLDPGRIDAKDNIVADHRGVLDARYDINRAERNERDILIGEGGDDWLLGGKGDDILIGGLGNDIYYYRSGDGDDRIIDSDKRGRLLINGDGIGELIKQSATIWSTVDGKVTLTQGETWKLAIDGGGSLDLGASFADGDYGLHRTESATGGTPLSGDLDPILDAHGNLQYDARNNVIVDPAVESPGRADDLHGSAGADTIRALAGNDVIEAHGGADLVEGGAGNDIVAGQDGADTLWGDVALTGASPLATALANGDTDGSQAIKGDWIDGGGDDDLLIGAAAQDLLSGGNGNDLLIGGAGDDLLLGDATIASGTTDWQVSRFIENDATLYRWELSQGTTTGSDAVGGADVIYGGQGEDWAFAGAGDDLVDGGADADVLFGEAGNDILLGGGGNDVINGDNPSLPENLQGNDWIDGGDGDDRIFGMAGDDIIIGGQGVDTIVGGKGRDTYIFNKGDGVDTIFDDDSGPDKSILVFGEGFDQDSVKLRKGSLLLDMGDGDAIHIENFDADNPLAAPNFSSFQFADGSSLTWEEMLAKGFDLDGTDQDEQIVGTGVADRIDGRAGNDTIWGLAGDDVITGGLGTDGLIGGLGNDTYVFNAGNGATLAGPDGEQTETLVDDGGDDTVSFAATIDPQNLLVRDNLDGSLLIDYHAAGQPIDRLLVVGGLDGRIEHWKVGAGDTARNLDYAQVVGEFADGVLRGTDAQGRSVIAGGNSDDLIVVADDNALVSAGRDSDTVLLTGNNATVAAYRGDGSDHLDASGTNATLRFADQTAAALNVIRLGNDLVFGNAAGDALTVSGWLAGDGLSAGLQTIEFADGSVWDGDAIRAALLAGTAGNDHLIGYAGADTIDAGDGNDLLEGRDGDDSLNGGTGDDTLSGGTGNDRLAGGEGADIYLLGTGFGADTVVDGGAGSNLLRFEPWQSADNLRAARDGNDLQLIVRGSADAVTVRDYYADGGAPQDWRLDFGGANGMALTDFLARPDDASGAITSLWAGMKADHALARINEGQYYGWNYLGGLVFDATPGYGNPTRAAFSRQTTIDTWRTAPGNVLIGTDTTTIEGDTNVLSWGLGNPGGRRYHLETARIESNDAYVANTAARRDESLTGYGLVTLAWQGAPLNYQRYEGSSIGLVEDYLGYPLVSHTTDTRLESWELDATITGYSEGLGGWNAPLDRVVGNQAAQYYQRDDTYLPMTAEIIGGAADNEIHAASGALEYVDGGAGNDRIYGGFASSLLGGMSGSRDLLYGNSGDDEIHGDGAVMAGGDGNDRLYGGSGADRYVVLSADELGTDRIEDAGSDRAGFENWYYQLSGTSQSESWQFRHDYEGQVNWLTFYSIEEFGNFVGYYDAESLAYYMESLLQSGDLVHVPLPPAPLLGDSKDFHLIESGNFNWRQDVVQLPDGIVLADLSFAWGVDTDQNGVTRATLDLAWHGATKLRIVMPRADDPIGFGIEFLKYANGDYLWMSQMIDLAPPMPDMGDGTLLGNGAANLLTAPTGGGHLFGMGGDDTLNGGAGNDSLDGSDGNDLLTGAAGNDVYVFGRDGQDRIEDEDTTPDEVDTVLFRQSIMPDQVMVTRSGTDLVLEVSGSDDRVTVANGFAEQGRGIEQVRFLDGTSWDGDYLAARIATEMDDTDNYYVGGSGYDNVDALYGDDSVFGRGGYDLLHGGYGNDRLDGEADGDELYGDEGNDVLDGGTGDDTLNGGAGDDIYRFAIGSGVDAIFDTEGIDSLAFGDGIVASALSASRFGSRLTLSVSATDSVSFDEMGPGQYAIENIAFADSTVWQTSDIWQLAGTAPTGGVAIGGAAVRGQTLSASNTLADIDGLGSVGYQWQMSWDGGTGWYDIADAASDSFTPGEWEVGLQLRAVASYTDGKGTIEMVASDATLTIADLGNNNAPTGTVGVGGTAIQGQTLTASHTLADADGLGAIDYQWQASADGGVSWSDIAGATSNSLTLTEAEVGSQARVVASYTDGNGTSESVVSNATAAVASANNAPTFAAPIDAQSATEDLPFAFAVPAGAFVDGDPGDSLSYAATLADGSALPTWLAFDAATRTFSGTPGAGTPGMLTLRVIATDTGGLTALGDFSLSIGQHLRGTGSSDTLNYSASSFVGVPLIDGGAGNDAITGSAGNDVIVGGTGTDNLNGGSGDDLFLLSGTDAGYDRFEGGTGFDVLQGSVGDDTFRMYQYTGAATVEKIEGNGGHDIIAGTGSSDTLDFSATELTGIAQIDGGAGNDAITGSAGNDVIVGGTGTDNLNGGSGDDVFLLAGTDAGYDRFEGGAGYDVLQGSVGDDTFRMYQYTGAATVEKIDGNDGNDLIAGTGSSDALDFSATELTGIAQIDGGAGNDAITGSAGNDVIVGGVGTDNLNGGSGDDVFLLAGTDAGYDRFEGGTGFDVLQGSVGDDTFRMYQYTGAATVEKIDGNGGNDLIAGTGSSDALDFSATELTGIAQIDGGAGNDAITGSAGNDVIVGGVGTDNLNGGSGDDLFLLSGTDAGYDRFEGGTGFDVLQGSVGDDTFRMYQYTGAATVEKIGGNGGNDIVAGTGSSDTLDFSATELTGIAQIDGGAGNDAITGSAGNDIIVGGTGTDRLTGGLGNDSYRLGLGFGADTVVENDATAGNVDAAEFLAGIAADQIWMRHVGNHLEASVIGTADKLTLENWYLGEQYHVEQFRTADGRLLLDSQVENLVQAMAAFAPPAPGQTSLPTNYQEALAPVIAANWQ